MMVYTSIHYTRVYHINLQNYIYIHTFIQTCRFRLVFKGPLDIYLKKRRLIVERSRFSRHQTAASSRLLPGIGPALLCPGQPVEKGKWGPKYQHRGMV